MAVKLRRVGRIAGREMVRRAGRGVRSVGRYVGGTKGSAFEFAGGAAGMYLMRFMTTNFESLNKHWWAPPVAVAAAAHIIKKKAPKYAQVASAAIGAAGAIGAMAYEQRKEMEKQGTATDDAQGFDTGILMMGGAAAPWANNLALDAFNQQPAFSVPEASPVASSSSAIAEAAALGL